MQRTKSHLVNLLLKLKLARATWLSILPEPDPLQPEAEVNPAIFDQNGFRAVTANIIDEVNAIADYIATSDFEPGAYELVLATDQMIDAWFKWAEAVSTARMGEYDYASRPDAPQAWTAFDHLLTLLEGRRYPIPESIERLISEPGITHSQIASIYGWTLPDGSWDLDKVKEELQTPGRHYNPARWVSPEIARHQEKFNKLWADRVIKTKPLSAPVDQSEEDYRKHWVNPEPAPEPIEQLLRMEGMTAQQVANMKQISLEQVYEISHKLGVALDHSAASELYPELGDPLNRFKSLKEIQAKIDKHLDEKVAPLRKGNSADLDLESRVGQLLSDDPTLEPETILRVVGRRYPTATLEQIKAICEVVRLLAAAEEVTADTPLEGAEHEPEELKEPDLEKKVNSMSLKQLRQYANRLNISISKFTNASQIRRKILQHFTAEA